MPRNSMSMLSQHNLHVFWIYVQCTYVYILLVSTLNVFCVVGFVKREREREREREKEREGGNISLLEHILHLSHNIVYSKTSVG